LNHIHSGVYTLMKNNMLHLLLHRILVLILISCWGIEPLQAKTDFPDITFHYNDADIIDVINALAAKKGVNVIMPMGANTMNLKLTLNIDKPMTLEHAWDMLTTVLDVAGYSLLSHEGQYNIVKNSKTISKEVIPLYVGSDPEKLPDTDERIRFLYYLTNLKVPDSFSSSATDVVSVVLKDLLPTETTSLLFDSKVNAVLITDKADNIKGATRILAAIDQSTIPEQLDIIKLRYVPSDTVAKIFGDILKTGGTAAGYKAPKAKKSEATYFSDQVRIIPEARTNKLLILGRAQAVSRVKDFIHKYIDVELESGESILHVYQLLYLDAASFAPVLKSLIDSGKAGGTGQSVAGKKISGIDRFFEEVIIRADQPDTSQGQPIYGTNKLIIAAKNEDWKYIKRIIEELDRPQPQVIIEVLIADISLDDLRSFGTQLRNSTKLPLPAGFDFQSAQLTDVITDANPTQTPTTIAADLLGDVFDNPETGSTPFVSAAQLNANTTQPGWPGSTFFSISDRNGSWIIASLLQQFTHTKVISQPHVIATNNKEAFVAIGQQRLAPGAAEATAAAPTVKQEMLNANLKVWLTPRISATGNTVGLKIRIDIDEFESPPGSTNFTRLTRKIETYARIENEGIIALGGLINLNVTQSINETPLLGRIPLLGWLFKKRRNENNKTNLTVFISPTIVQPRLRGGASTYTKEYVQIAERYAGEAELFDTLRDPITRFFFRSTNEESSVAQINQFLSKDELKRDIIDEQITYQPTVPKGAIYGHRKKKKNTIMASADEQSKRSEKVKKFEPDPVESTIIAAATAKDDAQMKTEEELKAMLAGMSNPLLNS